jgi:hypothetical protein
MTRTGEVDELVECAQGGDPGAFERLVSAHLAQIRRFARAFARSEADADDLEGFQGARLSREPPPEGRLVFNEAATLFVRPRRARAPCPGFGKRETRRGLPQFPAVSSGVGRQVGNNSSGSVVSRGAGSLKE